MEEILALMILIWGMSEELVKGYLKGSHRVAKQKNKCLQFLLIHFNINVPSVVFLQ